MDQQQSQGNDPQRPVGARPSGVRIAVWTGTVIGVTAVMAWLLPMSGLQNLLKAEVQFPAGAGDFYDCQILNSSTPDGTYNPGMTITINTHNTYRLLNPTDTYTHSIGNKIKVSPSFGVWNDLGDVAPNGNNDTSFTMVMNNPGTYTFEPILGVIDGVYYELSACGQRTYTIQNTPTVVSVSCDPSSPSSVAPGSDSFGNITYTLPTADTVVCHVRTAYATNGMTIELNKAGKDCVVDTQSVNTATQVTDVTLRNSACMGENMQHFMQAFLKSGGSYLAEWNHQVLVNYTTATIQCSDLGQIPCSSGQAASSTQTCGSTGNQELQRCQQKAAGVYCWQPITTCNTSQFCAVYTSGSPTADCELTTYSNAISGSTADFTSGAYSFSVTTSDFLKPGNTTGATSANPYGYVECIAYRGYKNNEDGVSDTPWLEGVRVVSPGTTVFSGSNIPPGSFAVSFWERGFWARTAADCTSYASVTSNVNTNAVGAWQTQRVDLAGASATLTPDCSSPLNDGEQMAVSISNDPSSAVRTVNARVGTMVVGRGTRAVGSPSVDLTMLFTPAGMPLATRPDNWTNVTFQTYDAAGNLISDLASSCTLNVQNRVAYDLNAFQPGSTATQPTIGSGPCSNLTSQPTSLTEGASIYADNFVQTGNRAATADVTRAQVYLMDMNQTTTISSIGPASTGGSPTADQFAMKYSGVSATAPHVADQSRTYALVFRGYGRDYRNFSAGSSQLLASQVCYVKINNIGGIDVDPTRSPVTPANLDVCLPGTATITITVIGTDGNPLAGADVELRPSSSVNLTMSPGGHQTSPANGVVTYTVGSADVQSVTYTAYVNAQPLSQTATINFRNCSVCTGTVPNPATSTLCPGDDTGLSANTPYSTVAACGAPKCEYTCRVGYQPNAAGTNCVPPTYVNQNSTIAVDGGTCNANGTRTVNVTVTVKDDRGAGGTPVPGVGVTLTSSGGTVAPATAVTTNASGVASFTLTANGGSYTLTATVGGATIKTQVVALAACTCTAPTQCGTFPACTGPSGCDNQCGSTKVVDCNNVCGGTAVVDACGVCGGNGSTCTCAPAEATGATLTVTSPAMIVGQQANLLLTTTNSSGWTLATTAGTLGRTSGTSATDTVSITAPTTVPASGNITVTLTATKSKAACVDVTRTLTIPISNPTCTAPTQCGTFPTCTGPSGCDNQCGSTKVVDCAGVCGGTAVVDSCGVCGGDGSTCTCSTQPSATLSADRSTLLTTETSTLSLTTANSNGWTLAATSGTLSKTSGATASDTSVFTPNASGTVTVTLRATSSNTVCTTASQTVTFTVSSPTCTAPTQCGIYPTCSAPSGCDNQCGSTKVVDCAGVCGGTAVVDSCGVCGGDGTTCTCQAPTQCGTYPTCVAPSGCDNQCGSTRVNDCAGVCGGTAVVDACGVCGGDGSTCACSAPPSATLSAAPISILANETSTVSLTTSGSSGWTLAATSGTLSKTSGTTASDTVTFTPSAPGNATITLSASPTGSGCVAATRQTVITVTGLSPRLALTANPATINADGQATSTLTAQLSQYPPMNGRGAGDMSGYTINFSRSGGTGGTGTLLATSGVTDAAGRTSVTVRAPTVVGTDDFTARELTLATEGAAQVVYNAPGTVTVSLIVPLEARLITPGGAHGTNRTSTLQVTVSGGTLQAPVVRDNLQTTDAGAVSFDLPANAAVPNGTRLTVTLKTAQHLRRSVSSTVQSGGLVINLGNPSTFSEVVGAPLKGKFFLPAGDIEGASGDLHDNRVSNFDITSWIAAFKTTNPPLLADLDGNASVGAEDLSLIIRNFNSQGDS